MARVMVFVRTTLVGALVFLVPLVVLLIVLRPAMRLAGLLARKAAGRQAVGWQPGYQLEPLQTGWVAAFLPQAPSPRSGEAMSLVECVGLGSRRALRGVDLALPREN